MTLVSDDRFFSLPEAFVVGGNDRDKQEQSKN
jgi:hypothetical protein